MMWGIHRLSMFQHTAARRRLGWRLRGLLMIYWFQHTAARRRLENWARLPPPQKWFQHTAARRRLGLLSICITRNTASFNTQPPEGGWLFIAEFIDFRLKFQHTAARRRLAVSTSIIPRPDLFQHTAARRRLAGRIEEVAEYCKFQHTAARRRLAQNCGGIGSGLTVSTHSRPKAAGPIVSMVSL